MDFQHEDNDAIRQALAEGRTVEALALTFWKLLARAEKHLDAAGLNVTFSDKHPDIPSMVADVRRAVDSQLKGADEQGPDHVWAASLIMRELEGLFAHYPGSGQTQDTARAVMLGYALGAADITSYNVGSSLFDEASTQRAENDRRSAGGKKSSAKLGAWHDYAFALVALQELQAPAGQFKSTIAVTEAAKVVVQQKINNATDAGKVAGAIEKALERKRPRYTAIAEQLKAALPSAPRDHELHPFILEVLRKVPE